MIQQSLPHLLSDMLIQIGGLRALLEREASSSEAERQALSNEFRRELRLLEQRARDALYLTRLESDEGPPAELEGGPLSAALARMVEETADMLGLASRVAFSGVDERGRPAGHTLSHAAERLLYLTAREALYQVQRHAGARRLRLALSYGEDEAVMSIEDEGAHTIEESVEETAGEPFPGVLAPPFAPATPATGRVQAEVPIISDLRSRLALLGGTLEIHSTGERGTRVQVRVPYVAPAQKVSRSVETAQSGQPAPFAADRVLAAEPAVSDRVSVLIVDSQAVTRAGLHRLLEGYDDLQVVGEAADGVQAVSETLELGPQVVLMDSLLPNGQSLEALRQIKQLNLNTKVLLLSSQEREEYLYETLRAGADGYVLKDIAPDELAQAIHAVARGEVLVQPQLAGRLLSRFGRRGTAPYESLTARELEVLRLLARGLRNKEIAARLFVSERTINFHLANIYQKLNVSGRTEALSKALELGLITA